jgi:RNA-binding protein
MTLTARQRAHLRSLAHHLKPIHHIGREGVDEGGLDAVRDAFNQRELLKVKVLEASPHSAREAAELLVAGVSGAEHVQTIGRTVVLYRRHPERPMVVLP